MTRTQFPVAALMAAFLCACGNPEPFATAPRAPALLIYDATRPAPTNVSAVRIGNRVEITFTDVAEGETLVSAYFTDADDNGPAATQNIEGTVAASGQRVVTVAAVAQTATLRLRNVWGTIPGDGADIVWGPFSGPVTVGKGKGHR